MTYKLLAAAAFSLTLGASALAQAPAPAPAPTGQETGATAGSGLPAEWEGAVGDAFFSDVEAGTLRSEDEVRANWQDLSAEQQAQVRTDCASFDTAAADTQSPASSGESGESTAAAGAEDDDSVTTGSTMPDSGTHTAALEQVCDWIDTM